MFIPRKTNTVKMNSSNLEEDVWSYLAPRRGPAQTVLIILAPTSALYIVIFMLGFVGNVSLLWLIIINRSFHTPTNYYLVNLSISDLLVLVMGLPHDIYLMWFRYPYLFGEAGCRIRALLAEASMISSVLTIIALTIERYLAICHPLSTTLCFHHKPHGIHRVVDRSERALISRGSGCCDLGRLMKVRIILVFIWILSICFSLPLTLQIGLEYLYRNTTIPNPVRAIKIDESAICTVVTSVRGFQLPVLASFVFFFLLPLILIAILYVLITRRVCRSVQFTLSFLQAAFKPSSSPSSSTVASPVVHDGNSEKVKSLHKQLPEAKKARRSAFLKMTQIAAAASPIRFDRQQQQFSNIQLLQNEARIRTNKSLIKMLICIVIAFFACYAPLHTERLLVAFIPMSAWHGNDTLWWAHEILYNLSGICLFANSVFNPILYNIMSSRFRAAFKTALCCYLKGEDVSLRGNRSQVQGHSINLRRERTASIRCHV